MATKIPGHIPIFFGSFLELPKCSPNLDPWTPYLSPGHFNKYKKIMETLKVAIISQLFGTPNVSNFWTPPYTNKNEKCVWVFRTKNN